MNVFFDSLNSYPKGFIPNNMYWSRISEYPQDGTEGLRRGSSIICFYFSNAFGQNFVQTIRELGIDEVIDWEPVLSKLDEAELVFSSRYPLKNILTKRGDMYKTFYGGDFQTALILATDLLDLFSDSLPPSSSHDYDGLWHRTNFTITLSADDDLSGVAETYYRVNSGPIQNISVHGQPEIALESASNTLEYWSVDNAGNEELPHKILTNIKLKKQEDDKTVVIFPEWMVAVAIIAVVAVLGAIFWKNRAARTRAFKEELARARTLGTIRIV